VKRGGGFMNSEKYFRLMLDNMNAAILMVDTNLKVIYCNKYFEEFFGIPAYFVVGLNKKEVITREIKWRIREPEEFQNRLFWLYENPKVVASDKVIVEIPRHIVLQRFSCPVYDEDQHLLGRLEVYYDITELSTIQEELQLKNKQLYLLTATSSAINENLELEQMGVSFLRRVTQVIQSNFGVLYVKRGAHLHLTSTVGNCQKYSKPPMIIKENPPASLFWGSLSDGLPFEEFDSSAKGGYFIGFPAILKKGVHNGLCLFYLDKLNHAMLESREFENIGMKLGLGINNAQLYREVQRTAVLQERDRIAMEMHDGLAQTLSYLGLGMDSIYNYIMSDEKERSLAMLEKLREVIDLAFSDVREAIIGLRVDFFDDRNFIDALEKYLQEFNHLSNIKVILNITGNYFEPEPYNQLHIIRIIQEALSNVRRHSEASTANVDIQFKNSSVRVIVRDNGCGFDKKILYGQNNSLLSQGIKIMKKRASILGSSLSIDSVVDEGTKVMLNIPVERWLGSNQYE
jgi:PAS domain S-box-containing protein